MSKLLVNYSAYTNRGLLDSLAIFAFKVLAVITLVVVEIVFLGDIVRAAFFLVAVLVLVGVLVVVLVVVVVLVAVVEGVVVAAFLIVAFLVAIVVNLVVVVVVVVGEGVLNVCCVIVELDLLFKWLENI